MEHRTPLEVELGELRRRNDALQTDLDGDALQGEGHRLLEQIDEWKKQSIKKIEQAAEEARQKVSDTVHGTGHSQLRQLLECREVFTARLRQAEAKNDYHERHLEYWTQFLADLQQNFSSLRTCYARLEYCTMPFISKLIAHANSTVIHFTKWCYYERNAVQLVDIRRCGTIQQRRTDFLGIEPCNSSNLGNTFQQRRTDYLGIEPCNSSNFGNTSQVIELTRSAYQGFYMGNAREVQTGEYQFRFNTDRFFIGIISKGADTRSGSLNTPSVYGWTGNNVVYVNGAPERSSRGQQSNIRTGDTISLIINYEQRLIGLKNGTTNRTQELHVDVEKCPLPWLLNVRFLENSDD